MKNFFKNNKKELLISTIIVILLIIFHSFILMKSNLIRVWDHSTYWINTLNLKYAFNNNSLYEILRSIYHSINYDDYNLLASTLLMPIFLFSKGSFLSYVMSILIIGVIPSIIIYISIYYKIYKKNINWRSLLVFLIPFVFLPIIHTPTIDGYLDVIGLIPVSIILLLTYNENFEKFNLKKFIILSICFLLTVLLRRYYVYFTVSYFVSLAIVYIVKRIFIKKNKLIRQGLNLFTIGISFSIVLVVLFRKMIEHIVVGNYGNSYNAYSLGDIFFQMKDIIIKLGLPVIILLIIGAIYLIIKKKEKREFVCILLLNMIISIVLFNRIQTLNIHHYYIFILNITLIISMFITEIYNDYLKENKNISLIITMLIVLYYLFNMYNATKPIVKNNIIFSETKISYMSSQRDELKPTMKYLKKLLKDNDDIIYTVASSGEYNNETFANYYLPDMELRSRIIPTPNVDLRDGFSNNIYNAKYVLVVTPKQLHLKEKYQQVVSIIYNAIENDSPIRDNYVMIKEMKTSSITVKIYEKVNEYDSSDKEYLKEEFNKSYKKYKELFEDRIVN